MRASGAMFGVLVVIALPGCQKIADLAEEASQQPVAQEQHGATNVQRAMGLYAKGFNLLIDDPKDMVDEYFKRIPKAGPQAGKKYHLFGEHIQAQSDIKEAKEAFALAAEVAPAPLQHLQPLAGGCLADIEKISETFKGAHDYYQAEDFKDDKGAKGALLHAEFLKAAEVFQVGLGKFEVALGLLEDQQSEEELKKFADKSTYGYWLRSSTRQAKKLVNAKPEAYAVALTEFEGMHAEFSAFKKSQATSNAAFESYVSMVDRLYGTAKRLRRAMEGKASPQETSNLRNELTGNYNAVVQVSNSLRELEARGLLK